MKHFRTFQGKETNQRTHDSKRAKGDAWYFEPSDYEGDTLWSLAYPTQSDAAIAAIMSADGDVTLTPRDSPLDATVVHTDDIVDEHPTSNASDDEHPTVRMRLRPPRGAR